MEATEGGGRGGGGGVYPLTRVYYSNPMHPPTAIDLSTHCSNHPACKSPAHARTVASSLEVVRPYCIVNNHMHPLNSAYSLVQVPHKCGTAMAVPAL